MTHPPWPVTAAHLADWRAQLPMQRERGAMYFSLDWAISLCEALQAARDDLSELRMRIEEADALATKKPTDDGEWIAGYHFNTGAWHRLLAEARKG